MGKSKLYLVDCKLSDSHSGNYPGFGEFVEVKLLGKKKSQRQVCDAGSCLKNINVCSKATSASIFHFSLPTNI